MSFLNLLDNYTIDNLLAGIMEWGIFILIFHINVCFTLSYKIGYNFHTSVPGVEPMRHTIIIGMTNIRGVIKAILKERRKIDQNVSSRYH